MRIGDKLIDNGFTESPRKPNLFLKKIDNATIYADMRGTDIIPIWEHPVPMVYFYFDKNVDKMFIMNNIKNKELKKLESDGIEFRISFYEWTENAMDQDYAFQRLDKERFNDDNFWDFHYHYNEELPNGKCKECDQIINDDYYHCSFECRQRAFKRVLVKEINKAEYCEVCGLKYVSHFEEIKEIFGIDVLDELIEHHTSYFPEKKIKVCRRSHHKIHNSEKYLDLRPNEEDLKKYYAKKKLISR